MRFYLLSMICFGLLATTVFAKEKDIGRRKYYQCTGYDIMIAYKIAYDNPDFEIPPCTVYEIINGIERKIGESKKTVGVCEEILEHLFDRLECSGMTCNSLLK